MIFKKYRDNFYLLLNDSYGKKQKKIYKNRNLLYLQLTELHRQFRNNRDISIKRKMLYKVNNLNLHISCYE